MVEAQIIEVLVCEEDYKHKNLLEDWDISEAARNVILRDIDSDNGDDKVWREHWLVPLDGENYEVADWSIHELMGREVRVVGKL